MSRQLYEYHPVVGFRFIANLKARVPHEGGGYLIQTNIEGFRCKHNFIKEKKPCVKRVILFGNSYTAGDGVSNRDRYSDRLENIIPNLEVYNFGLPATGTDQHYLIYKEFASKIEHDLMVIAVFVENIRRVISRFRHFYNEKHELVLYAKPYYSLKDDELILNNVPPPKKPFLEPNLSSKERDYIYRPVRFPRLKKNLEKFMKNSSLRKIFITCGFKDRLLKLVRYQPIREYDSRRNYAWLLMRAILKNWISNHTEPVILMPIPLYHHVMKLSDPSNYIKRLNELASASGCLFHNPLPDLLMYPKRKRGRFYFEQDGHLTPEGHIAIAKSLASTLENIFNQRRNIENNHE